MIMGWSWVDGLKAKIIIDDYGLVLGRWPHSTVKNPNILLPKVRKRNVENLNIIHKNILVLVRWPHSTVKNLNIFLARVRKLNVDI